MPEFSETGFQRIPESSISLYGAGNRLEESDEDDSELSDDCESDEEDWELLLLELPPSEDVELLFVLVLELLEVEEEVSDEVPPEELVSVVAVDVVSSLPEPLVLTTTPSHDSQPLKTEIKERVIRRVIYRFIVLFIYGEKCVKDERIKGHCCKWFPNKNIIINSIITLYNLKELKSSLERIYPVKSVFQGG